MINEIRAELIKEKRSANSKMKIIVPAVFVLFNILMGMLMGKSPAGKSYLMATSFNWYPIMVLPIVLSLLVVNICNKEKDRHHTLQRSLGLDSGRVLLAKNIVVLIELFAILVISSVAIYFVGTLLLNETIILKTLVLATMFMFVGSFPVIGISFLLLRLCNKNFLIILVNFILTFPSAVIAVTSNWKYFPWAYNLRMLAPIVGVHPNGTFLEMGSKLLEMNPVYLGLVLSIIAYLFSLGLLLVIDRR